MDLRKYCSMKAAGAVRILNVAGRVFLEKREWDADTGVEILDSSGKPKLLPVDVQALIDQRDKLEDDLETMDCFLADVGLAEDVVT